MPAVVGVVVVSLALIVAWVVSGRMGSDQVAIAPSSTAVTTTLPGATTVATTAAPSTVPDPTTTPPPTAPPTPAPTAVVADQANSAGSDRTTTTTTTTTTPSGQSGGQSNGNGGSSGGVGDLGIEGHPIQRPTCDGAFVTVVASVVGNDVPSESIEVLLDQYAGSEYLRTDKSCASFAQSENGEAIYVVYLGPFAQPDDACQARSQGPSGAYVKRLSNDPNAGGAKC